MMIEVKNLCKSFTRQVQDEKSKKKKFKIKKEEFLAVNNLSFTVGKGEIIGILGPNGAGKTTLLRMLGGILTPTSGHIQIDQFDYEKDKNADWEPYYLQQPEHDNAYASFRDNKYVVVRKGYKHPEIVMKIISVLFDYTRYEAEDADDVNEYSALNVEPTARPLVINVDYNEATFQITKDIRAVQNGTDKKESLWGLEKSYYVACENYLHGKSSTPEDWAAYKSRISAVGLLIDGGYQSQAQKYLDDADGELPKSLQQLEKDSFIQIIMGVKPVSYFDTFVKEWYEQGGEELTEQIRRSNPGE